MMFVSINKRNNKLLLVLLLSLFTLLTPLVFKASAHAAAPTEVLTITPVTAKPLIDPGGQSSGSFQLINQGDIPYDFKIYAAPYSVKGEEYTPSFIPIPRKTNASEWIHFDKTTGNITPNESVNIGYTVSVPAGTAPGGYYAVALAQTQLPKNSQGIIVNEQVGEIFYIQVAGPVVTSGKVTSWSADFWQKPPLNATLRLENDGGIHYFSNINVVVSDIFGNSKFTLNTTKVVLPQTIRSVPVSWKAAPNFGLFKISGTATVPGSTVNLKTKYVFIASQTIRNIIALVIIGFALILVANLFGHHKGNKKSHKNE